jgi:hypothetical protein
VFPLLPWAQTAPGAVGWLQIIGVVADSRNDGMRSPIKPAIYVPYSLHMWMGTQIVVKTRVPPLSAVHDMRTVIAKVPEQQITNPRDLHAYITSETEYA